MFRYCQQAPSAVQKSATEKLMMLLGTSSEMIQEMKFVARFSRTKKGKTMTIEDAKKLNEDAIIMCEDLHGQTKACLGSMQKQKKKGTQDALEMSDVE